MNDEVRVAVVGVGNCASSLIQGRYFYQDAPEDAFVPGLIHINLGGYHVRDIEFVAAFDVNAIKVGLDLGEAIYVAPNNTIRFCDAPEVGVKVQRGPTMDGIGKYVAAVVPESPEPAVDVVAALKAAQVGAAISHRVLTRLFDDRGVQVDRTYQLNFGGNTDFQNMLERDRLESKKVSKTNAVTSMLHYELADGAVHVGPSTMCRGWRTASSATSASRAHLRRCAAAGRAQARGLG